MLEDDHFCDGLNVRAATGNNRLTKSGKDYSSVLIHIFFRRVLLEFAYITGRGKQILA